MEKFFQSLLLLAVLSFSVVSASSSWTPCDHRPRGITLQDVKVVPDPAITGEDVEFQVTGSSSARLASGKLAITVYFHGIFVRREIYDLCQKTSCPVEAGNFVLKSSQNLPSVTPSGAYRLKLEMLDPKNKLLACAMVNFDIVRPNPLADQ
ncbi:putative phosphatidylglycerol/phosphatidylinositol transfer protein DDB_G0282179 [Selaginella moellendorffii]|uniref:putative phosphatidylglycerol/phosphatidylinositol transfer protein DDB_G0282179 n=1 Tax=Selaginella moellendorffii TaxID=88036 RepID=UPI000D1C56B1|nr:putative phosphatidylglycerol/phosphatidylinositol transfer protein DDB_G0282179 [Selaginella moellendorffii]|eukprot:XP_024531876.1 putative phosphatidylglycerol/phosphatidylinositol transfer protein DDB_G0282179 [Selaginella moellendorffii]